MALFDLLGRSWALGIIWQLSDSPKTFRQLQNSCESVSPTVLNKRLKELRETGLVGRGDSGYELTDSGTELFSLIEPLGDWSIQWAKTLSKENKNP